MNMYQGNFQIRVFADKVLTIGTRSFLMGHMFVS